MATMKPSKKPEGEELSPRAMADYNSEIDAIREKEFPMLQGATYLDHAGTTLYPKSLIDEFSEDMVSSLLGNPHSESSSSQLSTRRTEDVRLQVLRFFNANPDDYDLVFVANATAGIKLVMESFREQEHGFWYGYHKDAHTSLVGVREAAKGTHRCFESDNEVEEWLDEGTNALPGENSLGLFAYPAQSNMNGRRLPLSWTSRLRSSKRGTYVYSLLDAAAMVSTSPLDLSNASTAPDFTVLSFYKIFGFPDLGALIVRNESASVLQQRSYFGGGTVEMVLCGKENWHIQKHGYLHEQLEDGTLPVHSIIALDSALNVYERLFGSPERVALHAGLLAEQLCNELDALRHHNGSKVCQIYRDSSSSYRDSRTQGPIIAFNLRNKQSEWISNTEVEKLANIRNIQLRSGGLCNPGGIASALDLAPWEMKRNFSAGHRCGNETDAIGGKPTGVLRVSLGAMSNMQDVKTFIGFVEEFFVDHTEVPRRTEATPIRGRELYVETLTIYPIKSCGGWAIPPGVLWDVRAEGLAWDREWCLVHPGTRTALSQKKFPKMALLRPSLDLEKGLLRVRIRGPVASATPNEISVPLSDDPGVFQTCDDRHSMPTSQVCGENVLAYTYASKQIADFFTTLIGAPCTLARFPAAVAGLSTRHSKAHLNAPSKDRSSSQPPKITQRPILLSNESPILTISHSSLNRLNEQIKIKDGKAAHASVFRANIIVAEDPASSPGSEKPYVEDNWRSLRIGYDVTLDVLGGCRRCQMVCVDQHSAEKNEEPFVTLAKTRRKDGKVFFGVHTALTVTQRGQVARIRLGDRVWPTG
ncbi:hypothetical protein HO173_009872 [Letharia columbiana]|uniref:Molybdenum cofactor sulfurase n=1 Tax=Letharia columbiana TaxID=112416 RepID=A0A8H6L1I0_9LECA|nr:uncharacterized protein HO173_009872 [Letharia columbiana]KAF6232035.1 hypothetical protein HO173_009872 [Letharia columbiana]